MELDLERIADRALAAMQAQGFDSAQVSVTLAQQDELNITHNEASLLRSTESHNLGLLGIIDGRKASTEISDLSDDSVSATVARLFEAAGVAPQDSANAVSAAQTARVSHGPLTAELDLLADKVRELLAFRASETPLMSVDEGYAAHSRSRGRMLTSAGSTLDTDVGCYSLVVEGTARDGERSSSFNYSGGSCDDLAGRHAAELFGIGAMLRDTERQIHTRALGDKFVGEVVLMPAAVTDLLEWLQMQLSDFHLISDSSLYKESVGEAIASPLLTIRSRFDAPGVAAISPDAFAVEPVTLVQAGRLQTLLPSYYGSRKTGLPHTPVAAGGWEIDAGTAACSDMVAAVQRGALVGRLSMGSPAANGDFSGVIKNSFLLENGERGQALAEAMITGNVAQMLQDISMVSKERIDMGSIALPWLRIGGLHFS